MSTEQSRTSQDIAEAVLLREQPEATGLCWIPRGDAVGALLELHFAGPNGALVPTGILIAPGRHLR